MELAGDNRVLDEKFKGNDLQGVLVSGFEDDGTSGSCLLDLEPASRTDAPAIAGLEAGETELRHGGAEIVAESLRGLEEGCVDETTDGVDAEVIGASLAAAGAVEPGHRLATTDIERLAENVFTAVFDWFYGGHRSILDRGETDRGVNE